MLPLRLFAKSNLKGSTRRFAHTSSVAIDAENWFTFPRETEGNSYKLNWSLVEDGVSPTGNAYRNPRPQTLLNQLGHKSSEKSIQISLTSIGNFDIKEAGDTVSHEKFQQLFDHAQNVISNSQNVFVEDAAVGTNQIDRVGVRVISTCPEFTLASRNLLVTIPSRAINNKAKYHGWNQGSASLLWNGVEYASKVVDDTTGERPIVVYHGSEGNDVALQFLERNSKIIGANIVVGNKAPLSGFINVVGYAASVMLNDRTSATVTIPGIAITKDEKSVIIINADESVKTALSSSGSAIYGENHLTLSSTCVSTLWNGKIVAKQGSNVSSAALHCSDSAIICEKPDNASWPSKSLVFYNPTFAGDFDKKAALAELLKLTDGKKENILAELVDNNTVVVIRSVSELKKLL